MSNDAIKVLAAFTNAAGIPGVVGEDALPVVKVEADLSVTARKLGEIMGRLDLFNLNGEQVFFNHLGEMIPMTARKFRTWISEWVVIAEKFDQKSGQAIPVSLSIDAAATILESEYFCRGVRILDGINHVRCPVLRENGSLELLPWGYDNQTRIFTVPGGLEYGSDLDWEAAKGTLQREFGSFPMEEERSMSVQVAAMLALYIRHLPGGSGLRPGVLWFANKPGSGKSVMAKACLYPVLGRAAAAKMKKREDMDKELEAFCRASVPYIFLDNVYGGINSASIDQLLTSEESTGRAMGGHGVFTARNTALLLVTGNQIELNDDAYRRFLVVDLFEKGNPEERVISVPLNDARMRSNEWRKMILECLWALVRHWHGSGMVEGSLSMPSFECYAKLLGGIVEAAGYVSPFSRAEIPGGPSGSRDEMNEFLKLVIADMKASGDLREKTFTLEAFAKIARSGDLWSNDVGTAEEGRKMTIKEDGVAKEFRDQVEDMGYLSSAHRTAFSKRIVKWVGQEPIVDGCRVKFGKRTQSRKVAYTVTLD